MLIATGQLEEPEDPRVARAFQVACEIMDAKDAQTGKLLNNSRDRLAAGKFLAEYLKAKPAQKSDVKVSRAEDFLAVLALHPAD